MSQTLERALKILSFVAKEPRRIGEIAAFLGVHHSTALRLLQSLRKQSFVFELPEHRYRLGSATFRLGFQALEALDLRNVARAYMLKINEVTGETVHLGTLESNEVTYIDKVDARHSVRMHSRVGEVANLHSAAVAKAILAFLPESDRDRLLRGYRCTARTENSLTSLAALKANLAEARERGYVLDAEENEPGIHCIGMPIFDGAGKVVGGMSISTPMSRIDRASLIGFAPLLRENTQAVSRQLGWELDASHALEPSRERIRSPKKAHKTAPEKRGQMETTAYAARGGARATQRAVSVAIPHRLK